MSRTRYAVTQSSGDVPEFNPNDINPGSIWGDFPTNYDKLNDVVWAIDAIVYLFEEKLAPNQQWIGPRIVTGIAGVVDVPVNYNTTIFTLSESRPDTPQIGIDINTVNQGLVTSTNVLSTTSTLSLSGNKETTSQMLLSKTEEIDMDKVNTYLQMMESLLVDDGPINIETVESDKEEYEFKMIFSALDLAEVKHSYTIYFNQTLLEEDFDDDDYDDEGKGHKHQKQGKEGKNKPKFDDETEYLLEGIAIYDGIEYIIKGVKESEDDELELKLVIKLDEANYVSIEQEIENNETEYSYDVFSNRKKTFSISLDVENDTEFEIKIKTKNNGINETYMFKKDITNNVVQIKYHSEGNVYHLTVKGYVDSETGETVYEYKVSESNKQYHYHKGHKH